MLHHCCDKQWKCEQVVARLSRQGLKHYAVTWCTVFQQKQLVSGVDVFFLIQRCNMQTQKRRQSSLSLSLSLFEREKERQRLKKSAWSNFSVKSTSFQLWCTDHLISVIMSCCLFVAIVKIWACQSASVLIHYPTEKKVSFF